MVLYDKNLMFYKILIFVLFYLIIDYLYYVEFYLLYLVMLI